MGMGSSAEAKPGRWFLGERFFCSSAFCEFRVLPPLSTLKLPEGDGAGFGGGGPGWRVPWPWRWLAPREESVAGSEV